MEVEVLGGIVWALATSAALWAARAGSGGAGAGGDPPPPPRPTWTGCSIEQSLQSRKNYRISFGNVRLSN